MKTNKILLFSLAAAMMAGCADDEYIINNGVNGGSEGLNGKLVKAGLLGVARDNGDAETRVYSPEGQFVWMPSYVNSTNGDLGSQRLNQKIGLCWTGRNLEGDYGAVDVLDQKVYTNYEYEHVGWLDELAGEPKVDPCVENKLLNGAFIVGEGEPEANYAGTYNSDGRWNKYYYGPKQGQYNSTGDAQSSGTLRLDKGVFRTNNAAVFEGEYLAYYPYTKAFTKGQILANLPQTFTVDVQKDKYAAASDSLFSIGYIRHYAGGSSASGLNAKTLNGFLIAKLYNKDTNVSSADKKIKKVIFYTEDVNGIVYRQDLDAAKCVEDLKDGVLDSKDGELFFQNGTKVTTNALVANMATGMLEGATIAADTELDKAIWVALPVLPQNIKGLNVILIDDQDKSCTISMTEKGKISSNGVQQVEINLNECTFINEYLAVDERSFISAMAKIKESGSRSTDKAANKVKLLRDIELTLGDNVADYKGNGKYMGEYNSLFFDRNITIYSNANAKLTLKSGTKMHIKNLATAITGVDNTPVLTVNVPMVIEGTECCGQKVAKLSIGGARNVAQTCTVVLNKGIENRGTLALGNNAEGYSSISIKGGLKNVYDSYVGTRGLTTDAATVYLLGGHTSGNASISIDEVENDGNIYSWASAVDIWTGPDVQKFADDNTGSTRVVNSTIGTLVNNNVVEIGERTLMTVGSKFENNADALVKTYGRSYSETDGRLDVKATSSVNAGVMDNNGVVNFTGTNMKNCGLFIDQLNGQVGGKYVDNGTGTGCEMAYDGLTYKTDLSVEGIYVSKVATKERMQFALTDAVESNSVNVLEILDCDGSYYNLAVVDPKDILKDKDVYINADTKTITFKSWEQGENGRVAVANSFGHCVTVRNGNTLQVMDGLLSTVNNVFVETNANFIPKAKNEADKSEITIGGNLENAGTTTHGADILIIKQNLNNLADATFKSNKNFNVEGNVATFGTFDSKGAENKVVGNFTQDDVNSSTTFAPQTTTTINGTFACFAGSFERLGLNGGNNYRATVNVGKLGATDGTTTTAWPTEMHNN